MVLRDSYPYKGSQTSLVELQRIWFDADELRRPAPPPSRPLLAWVAVRFFASEIGGLGTAPMTIPLLYTVLKVPTAYQGARKPC